MHLEEKLISAAGGSGGFRGGKGGANAPPLWRLVVYFCVHSRIEPIAKALCVVRTTLSHRSSKLAGVTYYNLLQGRSHRSG